MERAETRPVGPWPALRQAAVGSEARRLAVLVASAFLLRCAFLVAQGLAAPPVAWGDDPAYDAIARGLAARRVYENAWFPPGYPVFLAVLYSLFGHSLAAVRLVQAALGAATCGVVYAMGREAFGRRAGWIAAALLAVYPGHLYMAWRLMAETLFILLVALAVLTAQRLAARPGLGKAAGLGALLGAAVLVKSNLIVLPPLLHLWACGRFLRQRPRPLRLTAAAAAVLAGSFTLVTLASPLANALNSPGGFRPLPGNAGHTLWWSNNPLADGYFIDPGETPEGRAFIQRHGMAQALKADDRFARDRAYRDLALLWIREHPGDFLALVPRKLANAFGPLPRAAVFEGNPLARWVHLLSYGAMLPFAVAGLGLSFRRPRRAAGAPLHLVLLSYTMMVVVFYGTPRFTLVVVPVLLVFAGAALSPLLAGLTARLKEGLKAWPAGRRLARATAQGAVAALVTLLAGETGLRFFGYGRYILYRPDPELLWVPLPHQAGRTEVGQRPITINGDGLRYPVDLPRRDGREVRIFTFGDSVTMGWGMDDRSHYSAGLERLLAGGHGARRYRVVSAGVNAYPTALCVRRFRRLLGQGYQIDVAVLAYSFNHAHEGLARLRGAEREAFLRKVAWKGVVRRSALYNFLVEDLLREAVYYRIRDRLVAGSWDMGPSGGATEVREYVANLERMRTAAAAHRVRLVFLLLGSQDQRTGLDDFQVAFLAFARRHGIPVVDMVRRLAPLDQRGLFIDHTHPSAAGHRLIAGALARAMAHESAPPQVRAAREEG